MNPRDPDAMLGALDLIEEAIHTLRRTSAVSLLCYFLGTAPFLLGLLFFWSDMSRSGLAEKHLVPGALGLALLFVWMKTWQAIFTARLTGQVAGAPVTLTAGGVLRLAIRQGLLHAVGLLVLPPVLVILLPLGWVYAFLQGVTVFGLRKNSLAGLLRSSLAQARLAPLQNHAILCILGLFSLFVFLDIFLAMLAGPQLLKMFLGVESAITLSLTSAFNTTFLATALALTYLVVDPILKTVFTLRCFHGEARQSGADLRVLLRRFQSATSLLVLSLFLCGSSQAQAAAPPVAAPAPENAARPGELNQSIDRVLSRPEYTWRNPRVKPEQAEKEESSLRKNLREWLRSVARGIGDAIDGIFRRLGSRGGGGGGQFTLNPEGFTYLLIALVAVIIGVLGWYLWRTRSRSLGTELTATAAAPLPDLTREDVSGTELPVDGWTKMALELLERGELRLAMRAFYLASLAHLAGRNLVSIARFKSNRDYERELQRRSHALPELAGTFSANVRVFDRVWYGRHEINADAIQEFRENVERIRSC